MEQSVRAETMLRQLYERRAVAILRTDNQQRARRAMAAAVRGGFRCIEFTLGCPGAFELIEEFGERQDLLVGVGTALRPEDATRAVQCGASFVVSPVTDEAVIRAALNAGAVPMPGGFTATEMHRAYRAGAPLQKFFPAPANGPEAARMLLGPLPFLRIVPTSGVDLDNVEAWFAAGVWAVGFVGSLFEPGWLEAGDYEAIERRAGECVQAARAAARPKVPAARAVRPGRAGEAQ